jgi:Taurine catabolism dioxygenase TauD, TfdA family
MAPGDPAPGTVLSPSVWRPADFADPGEWMVTLSAAERDEIVAAARGHVRDTGVVRDSPAVRLYATSQRQDFHCDGSDLVGLLCLKPAKTGGESKIVSSMAVYNEMLARRPDLVAVLRQPFAWDRNDEQSPGEDPFFSLPVIFDIDGTPRIFFIGWYIRDARRHEQAPRLTDQQVEPWSCSKASRTTRRSACRWSSGPGTSSC